MNKRLLAPAMLVPLILVSFLGGYLAGRPDYTLGDYQGQGIRIELYLYKNSKLVYIDYDDPATKWFLMNIVEFMAGDINGGMTSTSGTSYDYPVQNNRPGYVFVSYDTNYNYTYSMYALPSSYEAGQISSGGLTYDDTSKAVTLSASINIQVGGNITGVGLYGGYGPTLFFYDPLPTPLSVSPGDVVTVVYKIVVP
ncbi:MAG: hypothetical protein GSR84_04510 [Desulfurococcales archaeon]|nr:hypothetical protein [Desulfurococcales archaeon]